MPRSRIKEPSWTLVFRLIQEHPDGMTLEHIAEIMCCTRERVRQIQLGALRKLKKNEELKDIELFSPQYIFDIEKEIDIP